MNCEYEYLVYDPDDPSTYSIAAYPGKIGSGIWMTVHAYFPEAVGEKFLLLTRYNGSDIHVIIPRKIDGIPVRAVDAFGLKAHDNIRSIWVPDTVAYFGYSALKGCVNLEELQFESEDTAALIGSNVLRNCKKILGRKEYLMPETCGVDKKGKDYAHLTIPDENRFICHEAFKENSSLETVTIPAHVKRVESWAFAGCKNLRSVTIEGEPVIESSAFSGCEALVDVPYCNPRNYDASYLFSHCTGLKRIHVSNGVKRLFGWFEGCSALREVELPNTLNIIDYQTFTDCTSLQYLEVPASVRKIGKYAFLNCKRLQKLVLYSKEITIEEEAFKGCPNLTIYAYPEVEDTVAETGLPYVLMPSASTKYAVRSTVYEAVGDLEMKPIEKVPVSKVMTYSIGNKYELRYNTGAAVKALARHEENAWHLYDLHTAKQFYVSKEEVQAEILREDPDMGTDAYYFAQPRINKMAPNINKEALNHYKDFWMRICSAAATLEVLEEVIDRMPKNADGSFREKEEVYIGASCVCDGDAEMLVLTASVRGPYQAEIKAVKKSLTQDEFAKLDEDVFSTAPALFGYLFEMDEAFLRRAVSRAKPMQKTAEEVRAMKEKRKAEQMEKDQREAGLITEKAYENQPITEIVIPEGITEIGHFAFRGCENLVKVQLPSTLRKMGSGVFENCVSLCSVTLPDDLQELGPFAFKGCEKLEQVQLPRNLQKIDVAAFQNCVSLHSVSLPETLQYLEDFAFSGCVGLEEIVIPASVQKIGGNLFEGCHGLKRVALPNGIEDIGDRTFSHCSGLRALFIPEPIRRIGYSAFSDCSALTELVLPEGLEELGGRAFKGCIQLKEIKIPKGVTNIGKRLFIGCTGLISVNLPEGIVKIGESAFQGCTALEEITLPDSVQILEHRIFMGCTNLKRVWLNGRIEKIGAGIFDVGSDAVAYFKGDIVKEKKIIKDGWKYRKI